MKQEFKSGLALLWARVPEARAAMLKFVIEGCDNLASVSSGGPGLLFLRYHPGRREELLDMLESVCGDASVKTTAR